MKPHLLMEVDCQAGQPCRIRYNHRLLRVISLLECWHDTGCWWEGESEKVFYRLALEDHSIREIFYDLAARQWYLYKTYD